LSPKPFWLKVSRPSALLPEEGGPLHQSCFSRMPGTAVGPFLPDTKSDEVAVYLLLTTVGTFIIFYTLCVYACGFSTARVFLPKTCGQPKSLLLPSGFRVRIGR